MIQQGFRMAPISGNGFRPSLFNVSVAQTRTFHPTLAGGQQQGAWLGQTPSDWYQRAKTALPRFDELLARTAKIANQTERNRVLDWVGKASTQDSPAYRYASVKSDLQQDVEAYTPPNVNAYQVERRQNRVEKLENYNKEFAAMVSNAETVYGRLPEPVVIEREKIVSQQVGGGTPGWVLPVAVGAGALAVAGIITLLAKK
jgi:thiamine pyrophosphate-dependent acetolactate synthase large subunit-like protein